MANGRENDSLLFQKSAEFFEKVDARVDDVVTFEMRLRYV